jgi:hypothetical protein
MNNTSSKKQGQDSQERTQELRVVKKYQTARQSYYSHNKTPNRPQEIC